MLCYFQAMLIHVVLSVDIDNIELPPCPEAMFLMQMQ